MEQQQAFKYLGSPELILIVFSLFSLDMYRKSCPFVFALFILYMIK